MWRGPTVILSVCVVCVYMYVNRPREGVRETRCVWIHGASKDIRNTLDFDFYVVFKQN